MDTNTRTVTLDPLPKDSALGGLAFAMDPRAVQAELAAHMASGMTVVGALTPRHIRYKPGTSAVIAYSFQSRFADDDQARDGWLYVKCHRPEDYAAASTKTLEQLWANTPGSESLFLLPTLHAIVYVFPNDTEMRSLRVLASNKKTQRLLSWALPWYRPDEWRISDKKLRINVVRFKPEKRAVVRITTRAVHRDSGERNPICVYLRSYVANRDAVAARVTQRLWEQFHQRSSLRTPRLLAREPGAFIVVEGLEGMPLQEVLDRVPSEEIAGTAWHLWALHRVPGAIVEPRDIDSYLEESRAAARSIMSVVPEAGNTVATIQERLEQHPPSAAARPAWLHGDFHPGQVLLQANHGFGFLDFDRSHLGDPVSDVGNFVAHLQVAAHRGRAAQNAAAVFLNAYEAATASKIEPQRLRFWTTRAMLQLALHPFRELRPGWRQEVLDVLGLCREVAA